MKQNMSLMAPATTPPRVLSRPQVEWLPQIFQTYGLDYDERVLPSIVNEVLKAVVAQHTLSKVVPHISFYVRTIRRLYRLEPGTRLRIRTADGKGRTAVIVFVEELAFTACYDDDGSTERDVPYQRVDPHGYDDAKVVATLERHQHQHGRHQSWKRCQTRRRKLAHSGG